MEFIGPFALVFLGAGSIIMTAGENLVAIALAHGLAIGIMVAAAGHISGGVYNPALAVGLAVTRKINIQQTVIFIAVQLLGGVAAALALLVIFPESEVDTVNLGVPAVGAAYTVSAAVVAEIIATFFLMWVVFGSAVDKRGANAIAGLVIGLTITADIFAIGAITGAAMNPARWFGPALVEGDWTNGWVWIIGPIVGAAIAAVIYQFVILDTNSSTTED